MKTVIDTFVMQGVDIIVDGTVLTETGTAIARDLKKEGIPMLSIDCVYEDAYFFGIDNGDVGNTIGCLYKRMGRKQLERRDRLYPGAVQ